MSRWIEVDSPGGLMPGLTIEDIVNGVSEIRNPVLARVFNEMDLMEEWGSGLSGVVRKLTESGLDAPEFVELPGRLRVIVHIPNHQASIAPTPGTTHGAHSGSEDVETLDPGIEPPLEVTKIPKKVTKIPQSGQVLLAALETEPLSRSELLGRLGMTDQSANAARHIKPLIEAGLVEMTEPNKPRTKTQRHRITEAGRNCLRRASSE